MICRRGVMAAAVDSKSTVRDDVWVRLPSPVPLKKDNEMIPKLSRFIIFRLFLMLSDISRYKKYV